MAEQFGQVLIEAMACGLPVIAVDRGGPTTIVDDPLTGWLVEPDDVEALAEAMAAAMNDPEDRRRRGERARDEVVATLERHLETVSARSGGAGRSL